MDSGNLLGKKEKVVVFNTHNIFTGLLYKCKEKQQQKDSVILSLTSLSVLNTPKLHFKRVTRL